MSVLSDTTVREEVFINMIEAGKVNSLTALRLTNPGMYLGKEGEQEVVLLPNKYIPEGLNEGDEIEVFVYFDSEDMLIATTLEPKVKLNEFACLQVKDVNKFGVFLDWGLEKDLLVPFAEQKQKMLKGNFYLVYLFLDEESNRLVATNRISSFLSKEISVNVGDEVELIIGESTNLGVNVIINNLHKGLIYHSEVFRDINPGDRTTGYIKAVRPDGKIDVSLQKQGVGNLELSAQSLLDKLKKSNGFLAVSDKSDPELIYSLLGISKKSFKKAVGVLYKKRLIVIEEKGIRLV